MKYVIRRARRLPGQQPGRIDPVQRVISDVCVETRARRISVAGMANSLCCLNSLAANLPGAPTSFAGKLPWCVSCPRARVAGKPDRAAKEAGLGRPEPTPVLAGSVDPQHPHVAGGIVAPGVGGDLVERPPAAGAETLAHA